MVQAVINLSESNDRILNIIKAQQRLKNKTQAVEFIIETYAQAMEEPELKPKFIKKLRRIQEEGEFLSFKSIDELRNSIEDA